MDHGVGAAGWGPRVAGEGVSPPRGTRAERSESEQGPAQPGRAPDGSAGGGGRHVPQFDTAEELLDFFGVAYDPEVLAPRRVRLLKRYGMSVAMIDRITAPLTEAERLKLHGEALAGQWERLVLETTCASSYYAKKAGGCAACGTHATPAGEAA